MEAQFIWGEEKEVGGGEEDEEEQDVEGREEEVEEEEVVEEEEEVEGGCEGDRGGGGRRDQQQQQGGGGGASRGRGDAATFSSFSRSWAPWRKWLLQQHPVSPRGPLGVWPLSRCLGCHSRGNMKTMTSAGKMKCQASHTTREDAKIILALKCTAGERRMSWCNSSSADVLLKEPITKAEVLNSVFKDYQDHFLVVLSQASEYLQLVFGLEVRGGPQ